MARINSIFYLLLRSSKAISKEIEVSVWVEDEAFQSIINNVGVSQIIIWTTNFGFNYYFYYLYTIFDVDS